MTSLSLLCGVQSGSSLCAHVYACTRKYSCFHTQIVTCALFLERKIGLLVHWAEEPPSPHCIRAPHYLPPPQNIVCVAHAAALSAMLGHAIAAVQRKMLATGKGLPWLMCSVNS